MQHEQRIKAFLSQHDPSSIMSITNFPNFSNASATGHVSKSLRLLLNSIDSPQCFSSMADLSSVIVDTGASVCISPHRSDFVTYNNSKMKIKDLSSSNQVAGEGILRWNLQDSLGNPVEIELMGYHIPTAKVRLLSPQVLLQTVGGSAVMKENKIKFNLDIGHQFSARFCSRSNLPLIPLAQNQQKNFWNEAFGYTANNIRKVNELRSVLANDNTNLSNSQKELLLWHQRLSHTSMHWVQILMRDRKWLPSQENESLHKGAYIKSGSHSRRQRFPHTKISC